MSMSIPQSCFRQLSRSSLRHGSLPAFLTPAFSQPRQTQCFSTTSPTMSRVGRSAIRVPPEVSLDFVDLPESSERSKKARGVDIPKTEAVVKGPLG